jgi:hypothetical protein
VDVDVSVGVDDDDVGVAAIDDVDNRSASVIVDVVNERVGVVDDDVNKSVGVVDDVNKSVGVVDDVVNESVAVDDDDIGVAVIDDVVNKSVGVVDDIGVNDRLGVVDDVVNESVAVDDDDVGVTVIDDVVVNKSVGVVMVITPVPVLVFFINVAVDDDVMMSDLVVPLDVRVDELISRLRCTCARAVAVHNDAAAVHDDAAAVVCAVSTHLQSEHAVDRLVSQAMFGQDDTGRRPRPPTIRRCARKSCKRAPSSGRRESVDVEQLSRHTVIVQNRRIVHAIGRVPKQLGGGPGGAVWRESRVHQAALSSGLLPCAEPHNQSLPAGTDGQRGVVIVVQVRGMPVGLGIHEPNRWQKVALCRCSDRTGTAYGAGRRLVRLWRRNRPSSRPNRMPRLVGRVRSGFVQNDAKPNVPAAVLHRERKRQL